MTEDTPACPECSQSMKSGGFVLSEREDDRRRACQSLWGVPRTACLLGSRT